MLPPFIRWASCSNLIKCWKFVRSLAYTRCTDLLDPSSGTNNVLRHPLPKFKVTDQTLHHYPKRERNSALLFARQLKESGFKHDAETYMSIIRSLCDSGMDVRLNNLFNYVIEDDVGIEISHLLEAMIEEKLIKAVQVLVRMYASIGRFGDAIHTVSEMKSRSGLMVSTPTCNFVMNELIEWKEEVGMVDSVFIRLKWNGFIPNVYTYGILMKGHCRKGRLKEALHVFEQMEEAGIEPNAFIYGTFIHGLSSKGKTDLALEVIKKLKDSNKGVDVFAYACVIRGFVKESKLQEAEDVFVEMKVRGEVVPDSNCYGALIRGYFREGKTDKALGLRKEMESRGMKADYVIVRSMMQEMRRLGMLPEAVDKFKGFMESGVFLDGVSFNMAIDFACRLGRMEDAMRLFDGMKGRKMKPWKMHYRTLMEGYCFQGEPWKALDMFQEMMRNGLTPDSTTYHVLARGGVFLPFYMIFKH